MNQLQDLPKFLWVRDEDSARRLKIEINAKNADLAKINVLGTSSIQGIDNEPAHYIAAYVTWERCWEFCVFKK